ncbi:MAG: hypothetical protein ACLPVI_03395 [Dehalococcoidales bacterium]
MKKSCLFRGAGVIGLVAMAILLMISPVLANTTTTTTPPTPPTVTTNAATYTQMSSTGNPEITFNGILTIGSYKSVYVYFEYGLTTAYGYTSTKITKKTSGTFSATAITNLAVGTTYDYRADVKYGSTVIQGSNQTAAVSDGSGGGSGGGSTVIYTGITVDPSATMTINNDVLCIGDINVGDGGTLNINGDVHCTGTIENSDGCLNIYGDLFTNSLTQDNPTSDGDLYISGNATVYSTLTTGNCDDFEITGNLTCDNLTFLADGLLYVNGNVSSSYLTVSQDGIDFWINGDLTTGTFTLGQGVSSSMEVGGRLYCSAGYTLSPNASLTTGDQEVMGGVNVDANANLYIKGTAYFYGGYTLASGASLTVGNMPTLTPITTTGD